MFLLRSLEFEGGSNSEELDKKRPILSDKVSCSVGSSAAPAASRRLSLLDTTPFTATSVTYFLSVFIAKRGMAFEFLSYHCHCDRLLVYFFMEKFSCSFYFLLVPLGLPLLCTFGSNRIFLVNVSYLSDFF